MMDSKQSRKGNVYFINFRAAVLRTDVTSKNMYMPVNNTSELAER